MSEAINSAVSDRICQHMNEDHADALILYAQVFGDAPSTEAAKMLSIDPQGMDLSVQIEGKNRDIRIKFTAPLQNAEDAHYTLIEMLKQARRGMPGG